MLPLPHANPIPTPVQKMPVTPIIGDLLVYETVDTKVAVNATYPDYGTAHPNSAKWPDHKFCWAEAGDKGLQRWVYVAARSSQHLYNWEVDTSAERPTVRQTFLIPREEFVGGEASYAPPDFLDTDKYELVATSQSRTDISKLDNLFVAVQVVWEDLTAIISGQEFDSETGELRTVTKEKVPAGTAGEFDGDTGTIKEIAPINSLWSLRTIKQAAGLAGNGDGTERSYPEIVQYAWPAVLSAAQPYTIVSIPLRAGGYEQIVIPNMLRHRYSGPCVSEVIETWTKDPPAAIAALNEVPVPEAIDYKGKLYDFDVEPTLHIGFRLYETSGTNHPDYKYYYYEQWVRRTNHTDWPDFILVDQITRPFMGGYLTRKRKIFNPHTKALGDTVLLSVLSVGATTAELQWATAAPGYVGVYRKLSSEGPSGWELIDDIPPGSAYTATGLSPLTAYDFKVVVGVSPGTYVTSNIASITTDYGVPVVTSALTASAAQGSLFAGYTITAAGPAESFGAVGLPSGRVVDSDTGAISGTPTGEDGGELDIELSAVNPIGTGTATLVLSYTAKPHICTNDTLTVRTTTLAAAVLKDIAFSYQVYADNSPMTYAASGLPTGLSIDSGTGEISGTVTSPSTNTSYPVSVTAGNAAGTSTAATLTLSFVAPPQVTAATVEVNQDDYVYYSVVASNSPTLFEASGLPLGLSINAGTGVISGTIIGDASASTAVTVTATNAAGSGSNTITIDYTARPVITYGLTFDHGYGETGISITPTASNSPTIWMLSTYSRPALATQDYIESFGLTFTATTGEIFGDATGVSTDAGGWVLELTAYNAAGWSEVEYVTITVS